MSPPAACAGHTTTAAASEADLLAAAALGCPGVAKLSPAGQRQVATYLPGRRVLGVRVGDDRVEIAVVVRWGVTAAEVDRQVRGAVAPYALARLVDVHIADLQLPQDLAADEAAPPLALPAGSSG